MTAVLTHIGIMVTRTATQVGYIDREPDATEPLLGANTDPNAEISSLTGVPHPPIGSSPAPPATPGLSEEPLDPHGASLAAPPFKPQADERLSSSARFKKRRDHRNSA
jgi:hypothetical protein